MSCENIVDIVPLSLYIYIYIIEAFDHLLTCSTIFHIITHIIYLFMFYILVILINEKKI